MSNESPCVFISHRHEDKGIADIFREALVEWSNGTVGVFQSSHAENAMMIGDELEQSVKDAIVASDIVLLLYTTDENDWSWCMYECGLAQDPQVMVTRLVVFHTTKEPPSPLQHLVTVPFTGEALRTLASDFHKDPGFFPGRTEAIAPQLSEEQVDARAAKLLATLEETIPRVEPQEVLRYDQVTLGLDLETLDEVRAIDRDGGHDEALARAREIIAERACVRGVKGQPQAHFNFENVSEGTTLLADLVGRWRSESNNPTLAWPDELYDEMARAMLNRRERALSTAFDSLEPDTDRWIMPVLSRFRVVPAEQCVEFDVLLCGIRPEMARRMLECEE